ncbi:MAG: hypothetical protein ABJD53_05120 [Gammaproteobacteria bacterium]
MKTITSIDLLEAAAYALISERCRPSYLHDVRGGLQAVHGAIELLVRAAKDPGNAALAEKAAGLARSAMLNHEKSLVELLEQIAPRHELATAINVGELVGDTLQFVRNDAASKSITLRLQRSPDLNVLAEAHKFRFLILGLTITLTDGLPGGTIVDVKVMRSDTHVLIEFSSIVACASILRPEDLLGSGRQLPSPPELILSLTRAWASANGGSVELTADSQSPNAVRLYYPLAVA